ncbi:MAG: manganese efflux pump [Heliobacteriaceae bacterium]|nr:manganese efflux pump [Heliobacteriaceae bacterium]MDD4587846.1 manganese efflux pump [Heliobacteriaceae bacterium]
METWTLAVLAVGLGADAFSVAVGIGLVGIRRRDAFLLGMVVALFHVFMPWLGLLAGSYLGGLVGQMARIIGTLILFFLGGLMIYHAWRQWPGATPKSPVKAAGNPDPFVPTFWGLTVLGAGVSMDALTVGFSLGTLGAALVPVILTFGIVAGAMTAAGCLIGRTVGRVVGDQAQLAGGLILIGIGIKLLIGSPG